MSRTKKESFPSSEDDQDRLRDKEIYRYLFSLAVVYRREKGNLDDHTNINFSQTGARFGEKADYARRIYNFITNQDHDGYNLPAKITTAELVKRLKILSENLEPGAIRRETINQLFGYLISLTHEERENLDISKSEADILKQQSLLNLGYYNINDKKATDQPNQRDSLLKNSVLQENILNLYKSSLDLQNESGSDNQFFNASELSEYKSKSIEETVYQFIQKIVTNHLQTIGLASTIIEKKMSGYTDKIQRRLDRIISQSGFDQIYGYSRDEVFRYYFTPNFIKNLAVTTIENDLIRDKIPLFLEYFDIQRIQPLPLYSSPEIENSFLLNQDLELNQKSNNPIDIPQYDRLTSLYAYRVTIWFRLGVEESEITTALDQLDENTRKQMKAKLFNPQRKGIIFKVDSTGVGTQLSQMVKIINRALFWDVKCIGESYFAIAHDLVHEVTGNQFGSPVWSHSLVRLCRLEYLEQALRDRGKYIDYVHVEDVARGDYLGFSLIEASAKSALQARLAAILQANIHPERYKKDLIATIIRREILRTADNFLDYYPFSLNAMESFLTKCQYLKKSVTHFNSKDNNESSLEFSHLYYDAYLAIIKTYLREGLYRKAKRYFDEIQILEKISQDNLNNFRPDLPQRLGRECEIFSGGSLAKYEILKAYYLYLFDEEENIDYRWLGIDDHRKTNLISKAWDCLDNAWHHLQIRVAKYAAINEVSQAIFYPYFIMLSHISFRKAKLFLYFPTDSANRFPGVPELKNYHYARLYFFEQARLQAAKHGNQETYAVFTSVQVWAYVMAGYLQGGDKYLEGKEEDGIVTFPSGKSIDLRRKTCLKFAQELRDHALISYTEYGRNCYYQIKEKSGISDSAVPKLPHYGNFTVEPIPLIREERSNAHPVEQGYSYFEDRLSGDGILRIDMALLHMRKLDNSDDFLEKDIYLFGTKAANLLFARGMCELCDDDHIDTLENWTIKITKAYRLFTYAWATAEDGGKTEIENDNQYKITRPDFTHKAREDARKVSYPPPEALSVRDIYPHRLSEMSDIGKVFAITARLLLMYLTKTERPLEIAQANQKLEEYESEINQLMAHFHSTKRCNSVLIEGQKEFNGHLRPYLNQIKKISQTALQTFHSDNRKYPLDVEQIKKIRHYLVKDFFEALQKRN